MPAPGAHNGLWNRVYITFLLVLALVACGVGWAAFRWAVASAVAPLAEDIHAIRRTMDAMTREAGP